MVTRLNLIYLYFFAGFSLTTGYEWKYDGCYKVENGKSFFGGNVTTSNNMTHRLCETLCTPHIFYGLTKSNECSCGENKGTDLTESSECTSPCSGDPFSTCGGPNDIEIYKKPEHYMGCYLQSILNTDRWIALKDDDSLNPAKCRKRCGESTYNYAALQSKTCYCGNTLPDHSSLKNEYECNTTCPGDSRKGCGGASTVSVYDGKGYMGCFTVNDAAKSSELFGSQSTTEVKQNNFVQHCMALCKNGGYFYTAVSGKYCHCGNKQNATERLPYDSCSTICPGDNGRYCGGQNAVDMYHTPKFHFGCMHFPSNDIWDKINVSDMTVAKCRTYCGSHLYDLAGIKVNNNKDDCYCSNKIHNNARVMENTTCKPCPDAGHLTCGGDDSISVYASVESYCHCAVFGDPHIKTSDNLHLSFQRAESSYVLVETVGVVRCQLKMTAQNKLMKNGKYSVLENATLTVEGRTYSFHRKGIVKVNGVLLTESMDRDKFKATISKQYAQLDIKLCGVTIRWDKRAHLDIYMKKEDYGRHVKGVCGNCNGDRLDDYELSNGINVAHSDTHGEDVGRSFEVDV